MKQKQGQLTEHLSTKTQEGLPGRLALFLLLALVTLSSCATMMTGRESPTNDLIDTVIEESILTVILGGL